jgi:hypothetical protein
MVGQQLLWNPRPSEVTTSGAIELLVVCLALQALTKNFVTLARIEYVSPHRKKELTTRSSYQFSV